MRIYSMTATFGKLEHQTLTLKPGLNIIEAPNEWGKSTWCAFLIAMLYGIDTRERTTVSSLAVKEHYAPWSGSPMSGRIDLNWNGTDITIERHTKGRTPFGDFRAYETATGLAVPGLTGESCGKVLLGVEKEVFTRAGFLRLSDLPVTNDDQLRSRLNALVTTGDESGTADLLAQKLKELKNRCYTNRSNGLLPQAMAQRDSLEEKLAELQGLHAQAVQLRGAIGDTEKEQQALSNHSAALAFAENRAYAEKLAAAQVAQANAQTAENAARAACEGLPHAEDIQEKLVKLRTLRDEREALHMKMQLLPAEPRMPETNAVFRTLTPQQAIAQAQTDARVYAEDSRRRPFPWYGILLPVLGAAAFIGQHWGFYVLGALLIAAGALVLRAHAADGHRRENTLRALRDKYRPLAPEHWEAAAREYEMAQLAYAQQQEAYRASRESLDRDAADLSAATDALTEGQTLAACESRWLEALEKHKMLTQAQREHARAAELVQTLQLSQKEVPAPTGPDTLTYSREETDRRLAACAYTLRDLQLKLGNCQGRMEALGQETALRQALESVQERIASLEQTYAAIALAQQTLTDASAQLQRRFAPKISTHALQLFSKLTGGRYHRLTLGEDLTVHAGAESEEVTRTALWRSDGTADQMYFALRLAVAQALTPEAPLILDDALVRFDDTRLKAAMEVLAETAQSKQVILFTCQNREQAILDK